MTGLAQHFTHVFFLVYAGLFPIVNPVGNAPIFLALTRYYTERERHALALRVAVNGFFLLLGSLLVGSYVLEFFGIALPVLRIAGGVVVAAFGWTLLQGGQELGNQRTAEAAQGSDGDAFYPLTMLLTVGPGARLSLLATTARMWWCGCPPFCCSASASSIQIAWTSLSELQAPSIPPH